jgi:murein DD-endopeptidase MepM/ murein hydrolase activator NlpD
VIHTLGHLFARSNERHVRRLLYKFWLSPALMLVVACLTLVSASVHAQTHQSSPATGSRPAPKRRVAESHDCGDGVRLQLSSPESSQGGLLEVQVDSGSPLAELKAEWAGHALPFWTEDRNDGNDDVHHALLGVDLERPAGTYELKLAGQLAGGQALSCSAAVSVKAGHFAIERLRVAQQFVEPNPKELERAKGETQRLREIYASVTPERLWRGKFRLPLDSVASARNFGRRRVLNGQPGSPHSGVDIPAVTGTPVHATQRGRVVLAEPLYFSGNTVVLDHGLGLYTLYGHLDSIAVAVGDLVEAGALLGTVGATGRVTGPHLHWGLVVNEARVDPLRLVALPAG